MDQLTIPQIVVVWLLPILFAVTVHEVAHGWVAYKLGDPTAHLLGRLTLNPIKHIDIVGTVIVPIVLLLLGGFIFGWAKPVPIDWRNLKNPKRDMALVAAAGPISNLIMAIIWAVVIKVGVMLGQSTNVSVFMILTGQAGVGINLVLMVLNLIPIPPLDGSRVVSSLLPPRASYAYNRLEMYGFFIILLLLMTGVLSHILLPIVELLKNYILAMVGI